MVVAENLGRVRQLTVLPNGDMFAASHGPAAGVWLALRDTDGDGAPTSGRRSATKVGPASDITMGTVWFRPDSRVIRWRWTLGDLAPQGAPEVIVDGLPTNGHSAKTFAFLGGDTLIVNIGSATNSCQLRDRSTRSPGRDPCDELGGRAGLWRFSAVAHCASATRTASRFATGLRNAEATGGCTPRPASLFAAPHGRDQLGARTGATPTPGTPSCRPRSWCRWSRATTSAGPTATSICSRGRRSCPPSTAVTGQPVGRCATKKVPLIGFPGHWAPMAIAFYDGKQFPASVPGGAFVAFHGSWNRAPLPQQGYPGGLRAVRTERKTIWWLRDLCHFTERRDRRYGRPVSRSARMDRCTSRMRRVGTVWRVMAQSTGK